MNVDDVLALVKAGFTADQIQAMNTQQEQPAAPDPQPDPAETPITEDTPASDDSHSQTSQSTQSPAGPTMDDLLQAIHGLASSQEALVKMFQAQNRANAQQPGQSRETGDDILAAMIRPKTNK